MFSRHPHNPQTTHARGTRHLRVGERELRLGESTHRKGHDDAAERVEDMLLRGGAELRDEHVVRAAAHRARSPAAEPLRGALRVLTDELRDSRREAWQDVDSALR